MIDKEMWQCSYPEYDEQRESTTFWMDFSIADAFCIEAIKDTYNRSFKSWRTNYKYLTELVGCLNHKIWQWYEIEGEDGEKSKLYNKLWIEADEWAVKHLKGEEMSFYSHVLD